MIERTVYLDLNATNSELRFAIESWFMPVDAPQESLRKVAIILGDRTVLASKQRALEIAAQITAAAHA